MTTVLIRLNLIAMASVLASFCAVASADPAPASMDPLPNRFTLLGGYGPDGLTYATAPDGHTLAVSPYFGPLIGAEYTRLMYQQASVSALGLFGSSRKSKTYTLALGLGWGW